MPSSRVMPEPPLRAVEQELALVRAFAARLERRFDEERHRLAREVHGQLGQVGPTIKMLAITLQGQLPPPLESLLDDIQLLAEESSRCTQRICAALRPPLLDELGLAPALEHQLELLRERTGVSTELDLQSSQSLPPATASRLYRLAHDSWTQLLMPKKPQALTLRGRPRQDGYEVELVCAGGRLAQSESDITDLQLRAAVVGGRFEFTTTQDGGGCARAWLPLEEQA